MARYLTPEEIALNQRESMCRVELEELEMREAQLELELEQDVDDCSKMVAMDNLRIVYKERLAIHRELAHIKKAQIPICPKDSQGLWRGLKAERPASMIPEPPSSGALPLPLLDLPKVLRPLVPSALALSLSRKRASIRNNVRRVLHDDFLLLRSRKDRVT
jgi:hypothetical protein